MAQHLLSVRVRPARVAILISHEADQQAFLLALTFCSKIWGGRFAQLLAVDPNTCDDLTAFRLGESRPEFVYGLGVDDDVWAKATHQSCQPRGYGPLRPEFVEAIKQPHSEGYILVDHALIRLFATRSKNLGRHQNLRLITPGETSIWSVYCAATFGTHYANLRTEYYDQATAFVANTTAGFIDLATEFVKGWQQCWLDVTGYGLTPLTFPSTLPPPTVVLVGSLVSDLSLFWSLRAATDTSNLPWFIPIPIDGSTDMIVLEKLREWLLAFLPYGNRPNYCEVTSHAVSEENCRNFADALQNVLSGSPIETVDYAPPKNSLPVVIPIEHETPWAVDISGRRLTLQPPVPKGFENLGSSRSWFVDLVKDLKTGRAVRELALPSSPVVSELLNGPCPPAFEFLGILRTGDGSECINVRCSGGDEVISIYLPTREEVLTEVLREHQVEPISDEKRSSYLPVIKRFGGLHLAASAFSGKSAVLLAALADRDDPKTLPELAKACKLGSGELSGDSYMERIEGMLDHLSERMKRIGRRRFMQYSRQWTPENFRLATVLEHWVDRGIVTRHWKIGPCRRCSQQYFAPSLDLGRRIVCMHCGHRISLPPRVTIGYALHKAVLHAIREGIIPVVLAGRFARGMANRGFFWLPGVKYREGVRPAGDIDLLACCDGHLIFGECKGLGGTLQDSRVWDDVVGQFLEVAEIAKRCKASLVMLAALVDSYPQAVRTRVESELGGGIPYILLTNGDLESGRGNVQHGALTRPLALHDLIPNPFPERPRLRGDKPRRISIGWGVHMQE